MASEPTPAELIGRTADRRLLTQGDPIPPAIGIPEAAPVWDGRRRIVTAGATLTGVSLVLGVLLVVLGVITAVTGGLGTAQVVELVAGVGLAATHWGWVHVAEITATSIENRRQTELAGRHTQWLAAIEPYTRYEVSTAVADDGSISIVSARYRPVPSTQESFTFQREVLSTEVHSADEPAAAVADRAESLRRDAAIKTESEREAYRVTADAYEMALMDRDDEESRRAARRAASQALSERINSNLRDPPLVE